MNDAEDGEKVQNLTQVLAVFIRMTGDIGFFFFFFVGEHGGQDIRENTESLITSVDVHQYLYRTLEKWHHESKYVF